MANRIRDIRKNPDGGGICLYHCVAATDTFNDAAQELFYLVSEAARTHPGAERHLFIDIDGHRVPAGGFDPDMFELQREYLLGFLMPYLTTAHAPFGQFNNSKPQTNEVPTTFSITDSRAKKREQQ